ncbi:MAG: CapA family protein [Oscillospiraceae bacterium]|nr:CapA family protein [Oscillospiraceae bacterium]
MAQQYGGTQPPNANQNDPRDPFQQDAQRFRRVEYIDNSAQIEAQQRAQRKRQIQARKLQQKRRRQQRRHRALIGIGFLLLLVIAFVLITIFNGSYGQPTDQGLDELDMNLEELDDEAEEKLYDGPPVATIAFVGDISASADQVRAVTKADGTFDFNAPFADIVDYFSADNIAYAVGDFETTMVDNQPFGGEPYYNAPIELAGSLRGLGFRLMSTANTYALNNGIEGLVSTKNYLTIAKLRSVGTYLSQADRDENGGAYIRSIHKIKFAFLSYTKGTDSVTMPEGCEYALNTLYTDYSDYWSDLRSSRIRSDVQAAKDAGAEVIIALVHWGSEYSRTVSEPQKEVADLLLSNGVDVIIGTHSHLVSKMGFESVETNDGTLKNCFVAYGLGDFYTDPEQPTAQQSMILNLTFARGDDGNVTITDANYVPIYNYIHMKNGVRTFELLDVYRNMAELKRVDMTSEQAELFNQLLDTVDTMHNYGGEELDIGPVDQDRRIVEKAIAEGEVSSADIRAKKREEADAAEKAAQEAAEETEDDYDPYAEVQELNPEADEEQQETEEGETSPEEPDTDE